MNGEIKKEEKKDIQLIHIIDRFSINLNIPLTYGFTRIINVKPAHIFKHILIRNSSNSYKKVT